MSGTSKFSRNLDVPDIFTVKNWEYPKVCVNLQTDVR